MKIYKKPKFEIEQLKGLEERFSNLSDLIEKDLIEISSQEIVIEFDLKLNKDGELVEHPVGVCTKFRIDFNLEYLDEKGNHDYYDTDYIDNYTYEVDVCQDSFTNFSGIIEDIPELLIEGDKIYL